MEETPAVLIVEPDEGILDFMTYLFNEEGFAVLTAADSEEALPLLQSARPALVFVELGFPDRDGWAFLERYHQTPGPHAPVVLMSTEQAQMPRALDAGAVAFLCKPFELAELLDVLHRHAAPVPPAFRKAAPDTAARVPPAR